MPLQHRHGCEGVADVADEELLLLLRQRLRPMAVAAEAHARFFAMLLGVLPQQVTSLDSNRLLLVYFCVSALDVLGRLDLVKDPQRIVDWVLRNQVRVTDANGEGSGGFVGGGFNGPMRSDEEVSRFHQAHVTMTYTALLVLTILGDDLSRIDKEAVVRGLRAVQQEDGSFQAVKFGTEKDMRFVFCACAVSFMLQDWRGVDIERTTAFIKSSQTYDGGFGILPDQEAHGGATYTALASLKLMGKLDAVDRELAERFLAARQVGGFNGRINKVPDTCYTFWVGGSMQILGVQDLIDAPSAREFVMTCEHAQTGGFSKVPGVSPDILHAHFSVLGMSLLGEPGFAPIEASLALSRHAIAASPFAEAFQALESPGMQKTPVSNLASGCAWTWAAASQDVAAADAASSSDLPGLSARGRARFGTRYRVRDGEELAWRLQCAPMPPAAARGGVVVESAADGPARIHAGADCQASRSHRASQGRKGSQEVGGKQPRKMGALTTTLTVLVLGLALFLGRLLPKLDLNKELEGPRGRNCQVLGKDWLGVEDLVEYRPGILLGAEGSVLPGQELSFETIPQGQMVAVDFRSGEPKATKIALKNTPKVFSFHGHGIFYSRETERLYVVNHGGASSIGSRLEVFAVTEGADGLPEFTWVMPIGAGGYFWNVAINSVVEAGEDAIYVTQWQNTPVPARGIPTTLTEVMGRVTQTVIQFLAWRGITGVHRCSFDVVSKQTIRCEKVLTGFPLANGLTINDDKDLLFVNDVLLKEIFVYRVEEEGALDLVDTMALPHAVDNIRFDSATGQIHMGSIPLIYQAATHAPQVAGTLLSATPGNPGWARNFQGGNSKPQAKWQYGDQFVHDGSVFSQVSMCLPVQGKTKRWAACGLLIALLSAMAMRLVPLLGVLHEVDPASLARDCQLVGGAGSADNAKILGVEDLVPWRDPGVLLGGAGSVVQVFLESPEKVQQGYLVAVDARAAGLPKVSRRRMSKLPAEFPFHPHGLFFSNKTQRLYVVNHGGLTSIGTRVEVFDAVVNKEDGLPDFEWVMAIGSGHVFYNLEINSVVEGPSGDEVYITRYNNFAGPKEGLAHPKTATEVLGRLASAVLEVAGQGGFGGVHHCTFDVESRSTTRCRMVATGITAANGITADASGERLFVADMLQRRVLTYERLSNGDLIEHLSFRIKSPHPIDNIHFDVPSGKLVMGTVPMPWEIVLASGKR
ncbi:Geranylgeranyl transferase type-1 subunit beta (Geranylgeranyl transferase type I subunit beta) (GGTase-I-beta) (Type I protein geranyl-geranyltransferase subunit beta) [Durusdinium trenchii]|uniref:Geranylgeranyl transferase type-1 subunit beta (Geranylgeranyl transferase type I subunit beta) (GGTase-I-beta) (Type I protein geranyl-geranyltransferase subunit beta) n=1 Tax=Durusdinium trenchii TaxID=1381693 RepID=A0ABP0J8V8_9DINO